MSLDLAAPIRTALVDDDGIAGMLAQWAGEPGVHTRRPAPADAGYPLIIVSGNITAGDRDGLRSRRPVITRDVTIYGENPAHYREVEELGVLVHALFHRNRWAISVPGFHVIDIVSSGPMIAPTDDDKTVARVVPLVISLKDLSA